MITMKQGLKTSENEKEEAAEIIRYKKGRGSEGSEASERSGQNRVRNEYPMIEMDDCRSHAERMSKKVLSESGRRSWCPKCLIRSEEENAFLILSDVVFRFSRFAFFPVFQFLRCGFLSSRFPRLLFQILNIEV